MAGTNTWLVDWRQGLQINNIMYDARWCQQVDILHTILQQPRYRATLATSYQLQSQQIPGRVRKLQSVCLPAPQIPMIMSAALSAIA